MQIGKEQRDRKTQSGEAMVPVLPIVLVVLLLAASWFPVALAKGPSLLKPHGVCSGFRVPPPSTPAWLPLHHRRGPCSPSHPVPTAASQADILRLDQLRSDDIRRKLSSKTAGVTIPATLGTPLNTLEYVVTVGLGTPAANQTVLIDAASDLSLVQCRPCPVPPCHRQKDPVFDPSRSSTYASFPCRSPACARLGSTRTDGCSDHHRCRYVISYVDGSNFTGTYSSDTLTMATTSSSGESVVISNQFRFGCNHAEVGFSGSDQTDGILGLGGGALSLVSQTRERAFSYCLPPTPRHAGFFTLGGGLPSNISRSRSKFAVTPMYRFRASPTYHVVILQAIAVSGRRLDVPLSVFAAGAVMDSGTIVTRLPRTAYRALRAAFRAEMKAYPRARPFSILDTCFNLTAGGGARRVKLPSVALVFRGGATVRLHSSGIMQNDCLAFAPNDDDDATGIIGNVQQRTFEVLYDVGGGAVGLRPGAC